jgi:hypothetical protein
MFTLFIERFMLFRFWDLLDLKEPKVLMHKKNGIMYSLF